MNLVWFRHDLRVVDNPALYYAMQDKRKPVIAVYLAFSEQWSNYGIGVNHQALTDQALRNLRKKLAGLNVSLLVVEASDFAHAAQVLQTICQRYKATDLYFNVEYPLDERSRDQQVVSALADNVTSHRFDGDALVSPWQVINGQGTGYKVFSAYARQVYANLDRAPIEPLPVPGKYASQNLVRFTEIENNLSLENSAFDISGLPDVAEDNVHKQLVDFCEQAIDEYAHARDYPAINGTSQLSSALALGTISAKQCYQIASKLGKQVKTWHNELIWRDFYRAVMWHYPHVCQGSAFNPIDKDIDWSYSGRALKKWQTGKTGIPIIDAAMRQLVESGWMHNRLRMIVASYLTKNLFIDWRLGEKFFAQHLFDYDFASNNGGWQWCASVGTDAAPYFRVFNPAAQQKKFDPQAEFIKRWLPQLAKYSAATIHKFESIQLENYWPVQVDLKMSRKIAIEQFKVANANRTINQ